MNHFAVSSLLVFLSSIFSVIFVFLSHPRTKVKKIWSLFSLFVGLWATGIFFSAVTKTEEIALFSSRFGNLFALFIPVLFSHFVLTFTNQLERKYNLLKFHYLVTIIYFFVSFFAPHLFVSSISQKLGIFYANPGKIHILFPLFYAWIVISSLKYLYIDYKTCASLQKRNQLKYVSWGTAIGFLGGGTTFLLVYDFSIYPYGIYLIPIYVIATTYAIIKYRLMDMDIVIKKSLVYSLLGTLITGVYFVFVLISEKFFQDVLNYNTNVVSLIFVFLIAIIFSPLRNKIQAFVDKTFLKGTPVKLAEENTFLRQEVMDKEKFKAVATMASGMAHEIKNPLTAIKIFSEYLPLKMNDPEFLQKFSRIVGKEADRINDLVRQLLEFSRPSAPKLEETSIQNLMDEVLDFLSSQFINCNIKVEKNFQLNGTLSRIDPNQFRQVFLNLFINAIEAMPKGGTLMVGTGVERMANGIEKIQIAISDTGSGIPQEILRNLFEPFHTTKAKGTGLGLSISKNIIESHGGKIRVESAPTTANGRCVGKVGQGTKFVVELPIT